MIMRTLDDICTVNGCFSPRVSKHVHWNRFGVGRTGVVVAIAMVGVVC